MQVDEKRSIMIINDNSELLRKLPECLSKHIEVYENIHKDIDSYDQHSMGSFRASQHNGDSYLQQFVNISAEFVNTISRLKNNFILLSNRYSNPQQPERFDENTTERKSINNFELLVSEHCERSAKDLLNNACQPLIRE